MILTINIYLSNLRIILVHCSWVMNFVNEIKIRQTFRSHNGPFLTVESIIMYSTGLVES